jgi:hypothetical protein
MPPMDDGVRSLVFCCVTLMGAVSPWWYTTENVEWSIWHTGFTPSSLHSNVTGWLSCLQFNTGETMTFNVAVVCLLSFVIENDHGSYDSIIG